MATAAKLKKRVNERSYWPINEYVKIIESKVKSAAEQRRTTITWYPGEECSSSHPDEGRMSKIATRLRRKGFSVVCNPTWLDIKWEHPLIFPVRLANYLIFWH